MLRITSIAAIFFLVAAPGATGMSFLRPPAPLVVADSVVAAPDTVAAAPDSLATALDSLRAPTPGASLGVPGTLRGPADDPERVKQTLSRMGASEVEGRTPWERKKNPRVAMICNALLPGLGQTYNGRRLKVGVMVGFASYYMGNMWLNYKRYETALAVRDSTEPGSNEFLFQNELADFYKEEARTFLWWSGAVWLLGLIDSWIDAHLYDVRSYTPPAPEETAIPRAVNERTGYLTVGFGLERSR